MAKAVSAAAKVGAASCKQVPSGLLAGSVEVQLAERKMSMREAALALKAELAELAELHHGSSRLKWKRGLSG